MSDTYERVRAEIMSPYGRGWITAGTLRWRLPKGARVVPALRRLEREGIIVPVAGTWWSREPVWERTK